MPLKPPGLINRCFTAVGTALVSLGLAGLFSTMWLARAAAVWMASRWPMRTDLDPQWAIERAAGGLAYFVVLLALTVTASGIAFLSRARLQRRRHDTLQANDLRAPVLYLRSFTVDAPSAVAGWERQFAAALQEIGPVVAIGRPDKHPVPSLGSAGRLVVGDRWQEVVTETMDRAALVVLRLGETPGVWWEAEQALTTMAPERLLLMIPASRAEYEQVCKRLQPLLAHPLPPFDDAAPSGLAVPTPGWWGATATWLVMFDPDGTPRRLGVRARSMIWMYCSTAENSHLQRLGGCKRCAS